MMLMRVFFQVQVVAADVMGDAAFLLLLHPVHGRRTLVYLADTVRDARIEEDALSGRRLSGVDVRHNSDVPATIQRDSACHGIFSLTLRAEARALMRL